MRKKLSSKNSRKKWNVKILLFPKVKVLSLAGCRVVMAVNRYKK